MADSKTILEAEKCFHIYNHAVGTEMLFKTDRNYHFFLYLVKKHLISFVDIYAYCLMPNHFHLIILIKEENEILAKKKAKTSIPLLISQQFSNLFNSYAQAFNKENNRKGSLFLNRFKRKIIKDEKYLKKLIHYIHYNPVLANLCKNIYDWNYSSYNAIISNRPTLLARSKIVELFHNKLNFIYCHKTLPQISGL
ncbi:MAG: transposase [Bacteroidota bacterium]|nr:transposase [Bacteroidota bacterium]